ncbi:hypothetical protein PAMP_020058 [Pampus punctatissimus]
MKRPYVTAGCGSAFVLWTPQHDDDDDDAFTRAMTAGAAGAATMLQRYEVSTQISFNVFGEKLTNFSAVCVVVASLDVNCIRYNTLSR